MKIIPIFIPHTGCPYRCVYCDQHKISGVLKMPTVEKIHSIIRRNLKTIPDGEHVEIAFFGGTFTSLPDKLQEEYLNAVYTYVKKKIVKNIRISTHPEAVTPESIKRFKKKGGRLVELGVQSLDKDVLRNIKRDIDFEVVKNSAKLIEKEGLKLGVQIMLGLPGDTLERSIATAKKIIKLKPETARIYPTLVLKGTGLAELYRKGEYRPLSIDKAIEQAATISDIFEDAGVKVIRIGLHPSRDLCSPGIVLAGPYHQAFGEMARSRQVRNRILRMIKDRHVSNRLRIEVQAPKKIFNLISGHKGAEKRFLERYLKAPVVIRNLSDRVGRPMRSIRAVRQVIKVKDVRKDIVVIDPHAPKLAKEKLEKLNYYVAEAPLHKKLPGPVKGHVDMMIFSLDRYKVVYEPQMEGIARLLRQNGYTCVKGDRVKSGKYPDDIIYNACKIGNYVIHCKGRIEKNIKALGLRHINVTQGYAKCSIVPVDSKHIITSDKGIKKAWERHGGIALLIRPGYIKLPGYGSGFIGGAAGVTNKHVFFTGSLEAHPDGQAIRNFIKDAGMGIIELYNGPLYDVGSIIILPCLSENRVLYWEYYEHKELRKKEFQAF
ncbi:MAG: DUF6873 family GME fold protein [Candidatus Omnitrophota bacterium]